MKLFCVFLVFPFYICAQHVDSFTVKKPLPKPNGFYCSDYMTDGRLCFLFTEDHKLSCFSSDKNPAQIPNEYFKQPLPYYTAPYTVKGDSIFFVSSIPVVAPTGERANQVTSGSGKLVNDKIFLSVISQTGNGSPAVRQVVVKKLP